MRFRTSSARRFRSALTESRSPIRILRTQKSREPSIDKFIIKGVVDKLSWNDKLATAEFRAEAKSSDVKSKAVFAHTLTMAVTGKATTAEVTNQTTYQIANQKGTTIDFGKLSKEWTYQFVNEGGNTTEGLLLRSMPMYSERSP